MKYLPVLILCLAVQLSHAQSLSLTLSKTYGCAGLDWVEDMAVDSGSFLLVGYSRSTSCADKPGALGGYDAWVVKTDDTGKIIWSRVYGGSGDDGFSKIKVLPDGYIFVGYTTSADGDIAVNKGQADIFVLRTDKQGNKVWSATYGGSKFEKAWAVALAPNGEFMVANVTASSDGDITNMKGPGDVWITRLSTDGALIWQKCYGSSDAERPSAIINTGDGNFVFSAESGGADGDVTKNKGREDFWLVKINDTGKILWQNSFGGQLMDMSHTLIATKDKGFIIGGETYSTDGDVGKSYGSTDMWLVKTDATGKMQWQKNYGGTYAEGYRMVIIETAEGGYLLLSESDSYNMDISNPHGGDDMLVIKTDAQGKVLQSHNFGGSKADRPYYVVQLPDSSFVAAGATLSNDGDVTNNKGGRDAWLIKFAKYQPTSINTPQALTAKVYPTLTTGIVYIDLHTPKDFKIKVFNSLGQNVDASIIQTAVGYKADISGNALGMYIIELSDGISVQRHKVIIVE